MAPRGWYRAASRRWSLWTAIAGIGMALGCGGRSRASNPNAGDGGGASGSGPSVGGSDGESRGGGASIGGSGTSSGGRTQTGGFGGRALAGAGGGGGSGGAAGSAGPPGGAGKAGEGATPASVIALAPGGSHTCVAFDNGRVKCWGARSAALGYATTEDVGDDETPASVGYVDVGGPALALAAGASHSCALLETGSVRCWGHPQMIGLLGYGNGNVIGDDEPPASAGDVDVGGPVKELASEFFHTCVVMRTGSTRCWGVSLNGRLGYGSYGHVGNDETPAQAGDVNVGGEVLGMDAGGAHTCALLAGGGVRCWGRGDLLGYGNVENIGDDEVPATAGDLDLGGPALRVVTGDDHSCALLATGNVRCWGVNFYGELGYGNTEPIGDDETPDAAGDVAVGGRVLDLVAGQHWTCALLASRTVRCWGRGASGALGYGNAENVGDDETPESAGDVDVGGRVVRLAGGRVHLCALLESGSLRCWGTGSYGRLGYGSTESIGDDEVPADAGDVELFAPRGG